VKDTKALVHVTKASGLLHIKIVDAGGLPEDQIDAVMRAVLKEFGQFSEFRDPAETRRILASYSPAEYAPVYVPSSVEFDAEIDFDTVSNLVAVGS
jgi:hypothetical protein